MALPNIPAAKRAGLPVDVTRLSRDGDEWLTPDERYALKTHGVCAQAQPGAFMIRVRTQGRISSAAALALADTAEANGKGWVHLTTRQQIELHHIDAFDVPDVLLDIQAAGLTTRSACGHTVRGVMVCPDTGVGLDEPFDCTPDAEEVNAWFLARTPVLDTQLPQRLNVAFGGCPACRDHARLNDLAFVSTIAAGGVAAYELWVGGSLGKSTPTLALRVPGTIARADVIPALEAVVDIFTTYGEFDKPGKARMKYLVASLGQDDFITLFEEAFAVARAVPRPDPASVELPPAPQIIEVLSHAPEGGWSAGVRPQRTTGRALVTIAIPLGDTDSEELRDLAHIADRYADGYLHLSRSQDVALRGVAVEDIADLRARLAELRLQLAGETAASRVRCCTGGPVCALAITPSTSVGALLLSSPALARNAALNVAISGCPNACAQHQVADIGFSGGKVTVGDQGVLGYQVWLGGDLRAGLIGKVVGRVAEDDVPAITEAIVGLWESLRAPGERLAQTVARVGSDGFATHIGRMCEGRWAIGPEPNPDLVTVDRLLPLAVAT